MHRFYIDTNTSAPQFDIGAHVDLPQHITHQIQNVLRLRSTERVALFTGDGNEWVAELTPAASRRDASARLIEVSQPRVEMTTRISMFMALTRPQRYELALAKCTELGAYDFRPIITERVLKSDSKISINRMQRWKRIVCESAELSGRVQVPRIHEPTRLTNALSDSHDQGASVIFLWEGASEPMFVDLLSTISNNGSDMPNKVVLVLGPVGGFSEEEAQSAVEQGAILASLGPRILRTETAAIAVMSLTVQMLP